MGAKVTVDDLRWLGVLLKEADDLPATRDETDRIERLRDWVDMCVGVRLAQKTKSKTSWHADLMAAYEAACIRWRDQCEQEAIGHEGDIALFRERHPFPQLRDFMRAARTQDPHVCPLCGSPLGDETDA